MKLNYLVLLLLALLIFANAQDDGGEDAGAGAGEDEDEDEEAGDFASITKFKDEEIQDTESIMKTLQDGDGDYMEKVLILALVDSTLQTIPVKDWNEQMTSSIKMLEMKDAETDSDGDEYIDSTDDGADDSSEDSEDADNAGSSEDETEESKPAYTAEDCQEFWDEIKDWDPKSVVWSLIDIAGDADSDEKSPYEDIIEQLLAPFYTGPIDRIIPAIFVLKGEGAFLITGPDPTTALRDVIGEVQTGKAFGEVDQASK